MPQSEADTLTLVDRGGALLYARERGIRVCMSHVACTSLSYRRALWMCSGV